MGTCPAGGTHESYNDYGRACSISEQGQLSRKTGRAFQYGFTPYIKDRLLSETVTVPAVGGESFAKSFAYNANGFKTGETIYGISRTFGPDPRGNLATTTDANIHTTTFSYDWGGVSQVVTSRYAPNASLTRVINKEGTVRSETRYQTIPSSGFTTTFGYDLSLRQTSTAPPVGYGNTFVTSYDNSGGTSVTVTRGPNSAGLTSIVTTKLDGFGRVSGTTNNVGVQTKVTYDACGRRSYESYPRAGAPDDQHGTSYAYDALDRLIQKTNVIDGSDGTYTYSATNGINVDIQDENSHTTKHTRQAFGDPRETRLSKLTDANNKDWQYTYNALGRLTQLTDPAAFLRKWAYNMKDQLVSETHPEMDPAQSPCSGGVSICYSYFAAGQLQSRTDRQFGQTSYAYDANDRLTTITRPSGWTPYNTSMDYDASDNRTSLSNGYASSTFGYDGANRLRNRTDTMAGRNYTITYVPDDNDFLKEVDYPSTNKAVYTPDAESRITKVTNGGATTYANNIHYHPSGAVQDFQPGGSNALQQFTFDGRYRLWDLNTGQRHLTHTYDLVGNVKQITDARPNYPTRTFTYDNLDRLWTAQGVWGAGSYTYYDVGNRMTSNVGIPSTSYSYDAKNRLGSYSGSGTLTYDFNGNTTADGVGGTFSYTPENLMQTATVGGATTTYRYDGDNLRKIRTASGVSHYYVHGPGNQILAEHTDTCAGQAQLLREYVYLGDRLLAAFKPGLTYVSLVNASTTVTEGSVPGGRVPVAVKVTTANGLATTCDVSVSYTTVDGTANAGSDYTTTFGTLTFLAGSASGSTMNIPNGGIPIVNDNRYAPTESFSVTLSGPTGGAVIGTPGFETVTIIDDDGPQPTLSIGDASANQGISGTTTATFTVTLSGPSELTTTVNYATADGTATAAGGDYVPQNGTLTFQPGVTTQTINITVLGQAASEPPEYFTVTLSGASNATIAQATGQGTIISTVVDLKVTKSDGVTVVSPNQALTYTIVVSNIGNNLVSGATVSDVVPASLGGVTWTCAGAGGGTCSASGAGNITDTITLPVGATATYTLHATVASSPTTSVSNTASVAAPAGMTDLDLTNNTSTDSDILFCGSQVSIVPDGRVVKTSIGAGAMQSFLAFLTPGASYSVEAKSISGTQAPGTLTVFRGDDGCGTTSSAQARPTTGIDPTEGPSAQRFSFTANGTLPYRITLVNGSGSSIPYQLVLGETTLFSTSWSTNGTYDTYYSLKNTTGATMTGVLTFLDPSGQQVGSQVQLTIMPNATAATNTLALGVERNRTGTAMFTHDGPPGAVAAEAVVANFSLNPPYVQPVKFRAQRELR